MVEDVIVVDGIIVTCLAEFTTLHLSSIIGRGAFVDIDDPAKSVVIVVSTDNGWEEEGNLLLLSLVLNLVSFVEFAPIALLAVPITISANKHNRYQFVSKVSQNNYYINSCDNNPWVEVYRNCSWLIDKSLTKLHHFGCQSVHNLQLKTYNVNGLIFAVIYISE